MITPAQLGGTSHGLGPARGATPKTMQPSCPAHHRPASLTLPFDSGAARAYASRLRRKESVCEQDAPECSLHANCRCHACFGWRLGLTNMRRPLPRASCDRWWAGSPLLEIIAVCIAAAAGGIYYFVPADESAASAPEAATVTQRRGGTDSKQQQKMSGNRASAR